MIGHIILILVILQSSSMIADSSEYCSKYSFRSTKLPVNPDANCWSPDRNGIDYSGTVNNTFTGIACQRWDTNYDPHSMTRYSVIQYPDATISEAENYCRNPSCEPEGPWCYTKDETVRWEYCDIPVCTTTVSPAEPVPNSTTNVTSEGKKPEMIAALTTVSVVLVLVIAVVIGIFIYRTRFARQAAASQNRDDDDAVYGACNVSARIQDGDEYYSTINSGPDTKSDQSTNRRPLPNIPGHLDKAQSIEPSLNTSMSKDKRKQNDYVDHSVSEGLTHSPQSLPAQSASQSGPCRGEDVAGEYADTASCGLVSLDQTLQGMRVSVQDYTPVEEEQGYMAVLKSEDAEKGQNFGKVTECED